VTGVQTCALPISEMDPRHSAVYFADKLRFMRELIKLSTQDSHERTEKRHNVNLSQNDFKIGDIVYLKRDNSVKGLSVKHLPLYDTGAYKIVELRFPTCRLMSVVTGKVNKHFTNVLLQRHVRVAF